MNSEKECCEFLVQGFARESLADTECATSAHPTAVVSGWVEFGSHAQLNLHTTVTRDCIGSNALLCNTAKCRQVVTRLCGAIEYVLDLT